MSSKVSVPKILLIALWTVAIGSFIFLAFLTYALCVAQTSMIENAYGHSEGIEESKTNNLFLGYYKPLKDSVRLDCTKIKTERIWHEKQWRWDYSEYSDPKRKIFPGINVVAPYDFPERYNRSVSIAVKDSAYQYLQGLSFYRRLGYLASISQSPDTIVLYFTTSTGFKSHNLKNYYDTIVYVKE